MILTSCRGLVTSHPSNPFCRSRHVSNFHEYSQISIIHIFRAMSHLSFCATFDTRMWVSGRKLCSLLGCKWYLPQYAFAGTDRVSREAAAAHQYVTKGRNYKSPPLWLMEGNPSRLTDWNPRGSAGRTIRHCKQHVVICWCNYDTGWRDCRHCVCSSTCCNWGTDSELQKPLTLKKTKEKNGEKVVGFRVPSTSSNLHVFCRERFAYKSGGHCQQISRV